MKTHAILASTLGLALAAALAFPVSAQDNSKNPQDATAARSTATGGPLGAGEPSRKPNDIPAMDANQDAKGSQDTENRMDGGRTGAVESQQSPQGLQQNETDGSPGVSTPDQKDRTQK